MERVFARTRGFESHRRGNTLWRSGQTRPSPRKRRSLIATSLGHVFSETLGDTLDCRCGVHGFSRFDSCPAPLLQTCTGPDLGKRFVRLPRKPLPKLRRVLLKQRSNCRVGVHPRTVWGLDPCGSHEKWELLSPYWTGTSDQPSLDRCTFFVECGIDPSFHGSGMLSADRFISTVQEGGHDGQQVVVFKFEVTIPASNRTE